MATTEPLDATGHEWVPLTTPKQIKVGTVLRNVRQDNVYVITRIRGKDLYDGTLIHAGPWCGAGFGHMAHSIDTYDGIWAVLSVEA